MSPLRFLILLISAILLTGISPANAASLFLTPRTYPSGNFPVAATVRDFNNDGFADIVSANLDDNNVSVFLNSGKGTFAPANTFAVGAGATEVASGDLDGDGNADLVVTDANTSAYVALGNGDGTFQSSTAITVPNHPRGIALGDFNADGILDLALALFGPIHSFDGQIAVLIGNGAGSFAPPIFYGVGTQNAIRLVTTDLNNDGKLDLAVAVQHSARPQDGLAVLLGNGDGTFQPALTSVTANSTDVAAADFNGDGKMDVALATSNTGIVQVVLGNGDGTFQPATSYSTGGTANEGSTDTVNAVDMNRDGFPDLVVGSEHTAVLLGDGSGGFGAAAIYGVGQGFARVGYFDGDQLPDIVGNGGISGTSAASIAVAFGHPDGAIKAARVYAVGDPRIELYRLDSFDSADFDGDGHADVVVSGESQFFFLHGVGDGSLAKAVPFVNLVAKKLIAADFNRDNKEDILAVPFSGSVIYTIAGNGDGTFQPALALAAPFSFYGFNPVVSDFNNDGKTDVAMTDFTTDALFILLGNGDGTFQMPIAYGTPNGPDHPPVADDFNLDGNTDLVVPHGSGFSIYLGHGDGTFDSPLTVVSKGASFFAAGDLNRDGKPDLAVGGDGQSEETNVLNVFLGNGDGTFESPETVYPGTGWLQIGDVDLDGRLDLTMSYFGRLVSLRGKGDGTFKPAVEFPLGSFTSDLVLRDLSGDGTPEVITNNGYNSLTVVLNGSRQR